MQRGGGDAKGIWREEKRSGARWTRRKDKKKKRKRRSGEKMEMEMEERAEEEEEEKADQRFTVLSGNIYGRAGGRQTQLRLYVWIWISGGFSCRTLPELYLQIKPEIKNERKEKKREKPSALRRAHRQVSECIQRETKM
ncbi:hypothetical protein PAAG_01018 [Paracoccidioides lutzii Pb01]|uniref:Uncharacterized protein n=1 Tax=Paracoccidioides lutzii (strain ATCC MYA-826 / Pb01) TaxID=502779 RepID=C1GR73_PARBA|nr:hypothetical protein PAAG_01018 [Paracoccidioides lutzii Pb01]EEH38097.2 hypothetical protein PAAG_01018 [Paracoccidioides lutzii Pb01]